MKRISFIIAAICALSVTALHAITPAENVYTHWQKVALQSEKNTESLEKNTLQHTLKSLKNYNPQSLGHDWIEMMVGKAAQDADFAKSIKDQAGKKPLAFIQNFIKKPMDITQIEYSDRAFLQALKQVNTDSTTLKNISSAFEATSRQQKQPEKIQTTDITSFPTSLYVSKKEGQPSIMERVLILAASRILGIENSKEFSKDKQKLAADYRMTSCLSLAQKNMEQCHVASHDSYDLSYCVGKHGVGEVNNCFSWILP